jgi:hypothetical protein
VRESFVYARDFVGDEDLNARSGLWLSGVANVRTHRTTKEKPLERFARDEKAALLALPGRPYRSLVLPTKPVPAPVTPLPRVQVERRPLKSYAVIAAGAL